jgi:hypothetical protein
MISDMGGLYNPYNVGYMTQWIVSISKMKIGRYKHININILERSDVN